MCPPACPHPLPTSSPCPPLCRVVLPRRRHTGAQERRARLVVRGASRLQPQDFAGSYVARAPFVPPGPSKSPRAVAAAGDIAAGSFETDIGGSPGSGSGSSGSGSGSSGSDGSGSGDFSSSGSGSSSGGSGSSSGGLSTTRLEIEAEELGPAALRAVRLAFGHRLADFAGCAHCKHTPTVTSMTRSKFKGVQDEYSSMHRVQPALGACAALPVFMDFNEGDARA